MRTKSPLLLLVVMFQCITLLLYFLGPIDYIGRRFEVFFWVAYYLSMLVLGARLGAKIFWKDKTVDAKSLVLRRKKFIYLSTIFSLVFMIFAFVSRVGTMSFGGNIGEQYSLSLDYRNNSQSIFEYVRMFFAVYLFGFFSVFLYFFKEFSFKDRVIGFAIIFLNVLLGFATGTNKYLFDFVVIFCAMFLLKEFSFKKVGLKKIVLYVVLACSLLSGALYFFALGQSTRFGSSAISGVDYRLNAYSAYNLDDGLFLMGYSALTSYLTQGYRIFDMSLDEEFEWTYGIGNSTFFSRQVDRILDTKISDDSYPAKLESRGLDRYINWSTFYLWWASDLTYFGVGILVAILGFLFRVAENTVLKYQDLDALILYSYLTLCFFYLSANNQLMQSGETAIGFLCILFVVLKNKIWVRIDKDYI